MVGLDKQPVDTYSSQASGIASRFQDSGTGVSTIVILHQSFLYLQMYMFYILITKLNIYQNLFPAG